MEDREKKGVGFTLLSLNSFVGLASPKTKTLKVRGKIAGQDVIVLVDSKATHNFIALELAQKCRLSCSQTNRYGVILGTGTEVMSHGVCKVMELVFPNLTIVQDFLPIPLGSANVILMVQWMSTLGDITLNLKKLTLKFGLGKRRVLLQGEPSL